MPTYVELKFDAAVRQDLQAEVRYQEVLNLGNEPGDQSMDPGVYSVNIMYGQTLYINSRIIIREDQELNRTITVVGVPGYEEDPLPSHRLNSLKFSGIEKLEKVEIPQPVTKGG